MNSLWAIVGGSAVSALDLSLRTVEAAAKPFRSLLQEALGNGDDVAPVAEAEREASELETRLAARIQEVCDSIDARSGEQIALELDSITGELSVRGDSALASEFEAAIADDPQLAADIHGWFALQGATAEPFGSSVELELTIEGDGAATIGPRASSIGHVGW